MTAETAPEPDWPHWTPPTTVDVDGAAVAYRRGGDGHPLLFLHGAQLTRAWLPFHESLARGADVVAPEHPGFGDTPRPRHMRTFADLALHYDAFLRTLDLTDVDLVGQGHGAWLAAQLAVTYPGRFRSLTLITPFGLRLGDVDSVDVFRLTDEEELAAVLGERADELAGLFEREPFPDGSVQRFEERTTLAWLAWNPRYDWKLDHWLARVDAPTLVLGADEDRYSSNEVVDRYRELIPGAVAERMPGTDGRPSSHLIHVEAPDAVAARVLDHAAQAARPTESE